MLDILIVSKSGDAYGLATKLAEGGCDVGIYIHNPKARNTGKGRLLPRKVSGPRTPADFYVFDMVGLGHLAESLGKGGKVVLGGGVLHDKLELDRGYGQKVATLTSVQIPESHAFTNTLEGIRFVQSSNKLWVFKPNRNQSVVFTFVPSETNDSLISFMKSLPSNYSFLLQEKVEGVEVSTEGWFDGSKWVCFNHTCEHKRLMEGDKGPQTGCMGNVVWVCEQDRLVDTVLIPLTSFLKEAKYVGPLDANCIVNEKGVWFLEWTARFGYDALQALGELLQMSWYDFLYGVATGTVKEVPFSSDYAIAVRMALSPYPAEDADYSFLEGLKVLEVPKEAYKHLWLSDVMWKGDQPYVAGVDGVLGCATARGTTLRECQRRVYRTLQNVVMCKDVMYRRDIGWDFEERFGKLKEWGWLNG